jgi:hypothetical protein
MKRNHKSYKFKVKRSQNQPCNMPEWQSRANQLFKLGNVARLSEPIALLVRRAERQWRTLQSEKVIGPEWQCPFLSYQPAAE